jgi:hypothetical protein
MATYTYDDTLTDPKDQVRFLLQDTRTGEWLVSDEEINWSIDTWYDIHGTYQYVAAFLADTIAARYAREAPISADGISVDLSGICQQMRDLATALRAQHDDLVVAGMVEAGGMLAGETMDQRLKPFSFGTGMHDDPAVGPQDYGGIEPPVYITEYYPGQ